MGRVTIFALALASFGCAARGQEFHSVPAPVAAAPADPDQLKPEDALQIIKLQRDQLRKYGEMEHARADQLQAEKDLSTANAKLQKALEGIRAQYDCPGCAIGDDLRLIRPAPPVVTTRTDAPDQTK